MSETAKSDAQKNMRQKNAHDFLSLEQMARIGYTNFGEQRQTSGVMEIILNLFILEIIKLSSCKQVLVYTNYMQ